LQQWLLNERSEMKDMNMTIIKSSRTFYMLLDDWKPCTRLL